MKYTLAKISGIFKEIAGFFKIYSQPHALHMLLAYDL